LEVLILEDCTSLVEVHESIGHLKKLVLLNLQGCKKLKNLPESISNLESLKTLNLSNCIRIDKLPTQLGNMVALTELHADRTSIEQLPYSFGLLKKLRTVSLSGCKGQSSKSWMPRLLSWLSPKCSRPINLLPTSISGLCSLTKLDLNDCNLFEDGIPIDLGSLSSLDDLNLGRNNFLNLPHCISCLPKLTTLWLSGCTSLQSISELPPSLISLHATDCTSIETLSIPSNLKRPPTCFLTNCQKLVEIQGLESLEFGPLIHMEQCNNLAYDFKRSLLQVSLSLCLCTLCVHFYDMNTFYYYYFFCSVCASVTSFVPFSFLVVRFQIGSVIKELDALYALTYLHFQKVKSGGCSFALFMLPRKNPVW
jgi:Leucine-rich repeat (LRR) protein